jgi:DNA-binding transcriptional LysR family regulator
MTAVSLPGIGDRGVTLEQLRSFVAVVQCDGFHQAGLLINRSQSAVTQNIKRLEECLDCSLLLRKQGRLLGLTQEGQRFFTQAMVVLEQVEQAVLTLKKPMLKGRVRLGVPDDFIIENLHPVISRCLVSHPSLHIDVMSTVSSKLQKQYQQRKLDIALYKVLSPLNDADLDIEILRSEPLYWVANKAITFNQLDEVPLVVFPAGCAYRKAAISALERLGKSWRISYTSASYENIRRAVSAGLGIGILSRGAVSLEHTILNGEHHFPDLPLVYLVMAVRNNRTLFRQVADDLIFASDNL